MSQFDAKAADWDQDPKKREMTARAVAAILAAVPLHDRMTAMELGCGTGLAATALADKLASITAVDTSDGMLDVLREKVRLNPAAGIIPVKADLTRQRAVAGPFDLIYTMMTLHHIQDVATLLVYFHDLLAPDGTVALLDLDVEDGSFHSPESCYAHKGFCREAVKSMLAAAGFVDAADQTAFSIPRQTPAGPRDFPVFLITAQKNGS